MVKLFDDKLIFIESFISNVKNWVFICWL